MWPENAGVVDAFLAAASQWRIAALSSMAGTRLHYQGLDYGAVRVALDALGIAITPELWSGLQIMEAEARRALNAREGK